jgi:hypothetical protein
MSCEGFSSTVREVLAQRRKNKVFNTYKGRNSEAMRPNIRSMILQLLLIPLFLCLTPVLFAQSADTGAIFGTVIDRMGAVLPEAKVSLTNQRTGSVKTITSNSSGFYDFEALGSSDYSISITRDGFKTSTTKDILINPGQRREVASKLEVGSISTSVTVESNPLQVKTETSDNSTTVASEEISTLLVNGRNFQSLATLVPGVNNTNGNSGYSGGGLTSSTSLAIVAAESTTPHMRLMVFTT